MQKCCEWILWLNISFLHHVQGLIIFVYFYVQLSYSSYDQCKYEIDLCFTIRLDVIFTHEHVFYSLCFYDIISC